MTQDPWREPAAETEDYPGYVVNDGRVTGSITVGYSRLPLWAFSWACKAGWSEVESGWCPATTGDDFGAFITDLLDARGELARLLCILADEARKERVSHARPPKPWWAKPRSRKRVIAGLRRCIGTLEDSTGGEA